MTSKEKLTEKLQRELAVLARQINETRKSLAPLAGNLNFAAEKLPEAHDTLQVVFDATETATNNILAIVEGLMEKDDELSPLVDTLTAYAENGAATEVAEAINKLADAHQQRSNEYIQLMTELSFQDLTGQTLTKLGGLIRTLEEKIIGMLMSIDAEEYSGDKRVEETSAHARLIEMKKGVNRQDFVDQLLQQYEAK